MRKNATRQIGWDEAIDRYLEAHVRPKNANTLRAYRAHLNQLSEYATGNKIRLQIFGEAEMELYISHRTRLDRKTTTVYNDGIAIGAFLKWCAKRKHIPEYTLAEFKFPKNGKPDVYVPHEDEIKALLESIRTYWDPERVDTSKNFKFRGRAYCERMATRDYCIVTALIATGQRIGEITNLKDTDLYWDHKGTDQERLFFAIRETKEDDPRGIPVDSPGWQELLDEWQEKRLRDANGRPVSEFLFPTSTGKKIETKNFDDQFRKYRILAGLKRFTPHGLRHYTLSRVAEINVLFAQRLAGHNCIDTTMGYLHERSGFISDFMREARPFDRLMQGLVERLAAPPTSEQMATSALAIQMELGKPA